MPKLLELIESHRRAVANDAVDRTPDSAEAVIESRGWVRDAFALVISNAYLARHGLPPREEHARVDEDIADAILAALIPTEEGN